MLQTGQTEREGSRTFDDHPLRKAGKRRGQVVTVACS